MAGLPLLEGAYSSHLNIARGKFRPLEFNSRDLIENAGSAVLTAEFHAAIGVFCGAGHKPVGPALPIIDISKFGWVYIARRAGQAVGVVKASRAIYRMVGTS